MAFFDDITKKVNDAGQTVVKKGRDLAELASLYSSISDEEKKIDEIYRRIGKLYVEKNKDKADCPLASSINDIKISEETIRLCKKKIRHIKGIALCPRCFAEVEKNAVFCSKCGEKIAIECSDSKKLCPVCGVNVDEKATFCVECGTLI